MNSTTNQKSAGNTVVMAMVGLVVVAALAGTGFYVLHSQQQSSVAKHTSQSASQTSADTTSTGTIDTLTQSDASNEAAIDSSADVQTQSDITTSNSTANSVGGAYDESNL